jgi:2-polyprenyl-3-methyl-5-hydroxy-6-metoxy-1,4-benzoquinol methylase
MRHRVSCHAKRREASDGLVPVRLPYKLGLGFTPWDRGIPASGLVAIVEGPNALAIGRAIDLGCGSGTNSIYLCQHRWTVTAVDMEPRAVRAARRNAEAATCRSPSSKLT